jgi:hypothetical protein
MGPSMQVVEGSIVPVRVDTGNAAPARICDAAHAMGWNDRGATSTKAYLHS